MFNGHGRDSVFSQERLSGVQIYITLNQGEKLQLQSFEAFVPFMP
jgi:hypothetical protein